MKGIVVSILDIRIVKREKRKRERKRRDIIKSNKNSSKRSNNIES